ncbi:MAG: SRPBCC family protein [Thermoleophilia bacterium]
MSQFKLESTIDIAASPERVWSVLVNFSDYPEWNPFIRTIRGMPEVGASLVVRLQPSGTKGMTFRPTVLSAVPSREFRWLGHLWVPGLFDGEHYFSIQPISDGRVEFRQGELFTGILVPLFKGTLGRDTKRGFEEMNQALKAKAEGKETPNQALLTDGGDSLRPSSNASE